MGLLEQDFGAPAIPPCRGGVDRYACYYGRSRLSGRKFSEIFMNRGHLRHSLLVELAVVAVWLAYLLWEQGVGGSNPLAPTSKNKDLWLRL